MLEIFNYVIIIVVPLEQFYVNGSVLYTISHRRDPISLSYFIDNIADDTKLDFFPGTSAY